MKTIQKIAIYIGRFLIIAIAVIIVLRVLFSVILAVLPDEVATEIRIAVGLRDPHHKSQEEQAAYQDHYSVAMWIIRSVGSPEKGPIPRSVEDLLYPAIGPVSFDVAGADPKPPVSVHPAYIRVGQLSSSIFYKRIAIDDRLSKAYTLAQIGALTAILIGLATTVLVALSSSEVGKQQTRTGLTIRVGALVFPALGTAAAAIIAFYDPNGTLARQSGCAVRRVYNCPPALGGGATV